MHVPGKGKTIMGRTITNYFIRPEWSIRLNWTSPTEMASREDTMFIKIVTLPNFDAYPNRRLTQSSPSAQRSRREKQKLLNVDVIFRFDIGR